MIGLFNNKTYKILDNSISDLKFSKNACEFRKQIINSFSDSDQKIDDLNDKRQYYNKALYILEENDEKRIKEAEKLEKKFYKKKFLKKQSTDTWKEKPFYYDINNICKSPSKNNIEIEKDKDCPNSNQKYYRNNNLYSNYKFNDKILKTVQSEKIVEQSKKDYEQYLKDKYRKQAKILADSLCDIKDLPEKEIKRKNMPNYFNLNMKNLRRIIQVNSIKKHLYSVEDDDLLIKNTKKLREEIRKTENCFYTIVRGNNNIDFLKRKVRASTIRKLNVMKKSHFGIPC